MTAVQVTSTPAGTPISFVAQNSPQPFGANFAISPVASASSGLTVTYSSLTADVCTVAGTTVTPIAAGICTIAANQGGNGNYNAALQVTQNVTIGAIVPGAPTGGSASPPAATSPSRPPPGDDAPPSKGAP